MRICFRGGKLVADVRCSRGPRIDTRVIASKRALPVPKRCGALKTLRQAGFADAQPAEIPLVILEACRTGTIGRIAVFRSVAPQLLRVIEVLGSAKPAGARQSRALSSQASYHARHVMQSATICHDKRNTKGPVASAPRRDASQPAVTTTAGA